MNGPFARELDAARRAALAAGAVLARYWHSRSYDISSKGEDDPVTSADLEANQAIERILRASFESYGWMSEETADDNSRLSCERVWIVDPLDGTKEFIARVPEFCVSIALAEQGHPCLGVIYNPIRRELFCGARAMGSFLNGRPVRVRRTKRLKRAVVLASRSEIARGEWDRFRAHFRIASVGSVAYKIALVGAGKGDATFTLQPKSEWDIAAGIAIVEAAGGKASSLDGGQLTFNNSSPTVPGTVSSNGLIHEELLTFFHRMALA